MRKNFLKLNGDKTEVLVITPPSLSAIHGITTIPVCDSLIIVNSTVRDLGVIYDSAFNLEAHVKSMCRKCYFQLHLVHKIRRYITQESARTLIQANVMSVLDFCNCLLYGLPSTLLDRLQKVQNLAARIVVPARKHQHVTPVLMFLHWLPIKQCIDYKITVLRLTFKALNTYTHF